MWAVSSIVLLLTLMGHGIYYMMSQSNHNLSEECIWFFYPHIAQKSDQKMHKQAMNNSKITAWYSDHGLKTKYCLTGFPFTIWIPEKSGIRIPTVVIVINFCLYNLNA